MKIPEEDQDETLLKRSAKGDEAAFTALYRKHAGVLYRFALRMTGSAWGAEEIVQDVFMTLIRDTGRYDAAPGQLAGISLRHCAEQGDETQRAAAARNRVGRTA